MNLIKDGWFTEICEFNKGHCMSLKVKQVLCSMKTKYQDLLIFESTNNGVVMVLDGMIQVTERDEFMYQEMIAMLPLMSHPCPERVLIIGGGDGGVAREVVKHPSVRSVVQCELDEAVVEMSRKFLPFTAQGFDDNKVSLIIGDGIDYISHCQEGFDVVITDSTDPIGPAEKLFERDYFSKIYNALKPDGIMCSQGECQWMENGIVVELIKRAKSIFPVVKYTFGSIPTYPFGQIGYLLCSKNPKTDFQRPIFDVDSIQDQFRYYSKEIHSASLVLSNCLKDLND